MASGISTYSGFIDVTFPVAGRDNDTTGFRNNFSAIKNGLDLASSEISAMQVEQAGFATQLSEATIVGDAYAAQLTSSITTEIYNSLTNTVPGIISTITVSVSSLTDVVNTLTTIVDQNTSDIQSLNTNVNTNTSDISVLQTKVSTLETAAANTNTRLTSLQSSVTTLQTAAANTNTRISILETAAENTNTRLTSLQSNVSTLQTAAANTNTRLISLQNQITAISSATIYADSAPTTSKGDFGDVKGMIFADGGFIYVCYANFTNNGLDIWAKAPTVSATW